MNYTDLEIKFTNWTKKITIHFFLLLGLVVTLIPFVWMVSTSLKNKANIFIFPPQWIPSPITFNNYQEIFQRLNFLLYFQNSTVIAVSVTLFSLFINSLAGYAFAKYRFWGKDKIFGLLIATMVIPLQVTMIPNFLLLRYFGMLNSYSALIIPCSASVFGIFFLRQFIYSIPDELIEAARIDGCSEFKIYWKIILPLSKPVLATLGIFTFMASWNDFLWPLVVMLKDTKYTLPVGLATLNSQYATEYGLLMAGGLITVIPLVCIFLLAQKYVIQSIASTGIKE